MRRKSNNSKKSYLYVGLFLLLIAGISMGYAALKTTLSINGTAKISKVAWDIHFANATPKDGSVTPGEGDTGIVIDSSDNTHASWAVTLAKPGDKYEFTIDVVNGGSLDAKLEKITKTDLTEEQKKFATYEITGEKEPNSVLAANGSYTLTFKVEFKSDVDPEDLPKTPQQITLDYKLDYVQN